jgi:hypothetical protein
VSHRQSRQGLPTVDSSLSIDTLGPDVGSSSSPYGSAVLNITESTSPLSHVHSPTTFTSGHHPQSEYADAYNFPRARRKSISQSHVPVPGGESDEDGEYMGNGVKSKAKKRSRGASISYLPFHRRRRLSNAGWWRWLSGNGRKATTVSPTRRYLLIIALVISAIYTVYRYLRAHEIQLEFSVYSRRWVADEVDTYVPLKGCFDPSRISPLYNITRHNAPRRQLLSPGVSLRRSMSCYDFSATIQPLPDVPLQHLNYHTYWRSDLLAFDERQTATLAAFLATQPLSHSRLIIWSNGAEEISANPYLRPFLDTWGDVIEVRQVDMGVLTKGTELEGILGDGHSSKLLDQRAWVDGDAVRLLVLWHFGGVWMDMDQILTRDLHPLTESEFVTQWDCYGTSVDRFIHRHLTLPDKPYFALNGALMHFQSHSPYLCEFFHLMASRPLPLPNTFTWGSHLYSRLHRHLLAAHIVPFQVLPWCFADPRNCRSDIRFPDPFEVDPSHWGGKAWDDDGEGSSGRELLEEKVGSVWTVHLHNQWAKSFPPGGWIARLLEGYKAQMGELERYAKRMGMEDGGRLHFGVKVEHDVSDLVDEVLARDKEG